MNKRVQKAVEKKRRPKPVGPITRRQQVAAIQQIKGLEIAAAVAKTIREAVKQEVETQLKAIKDTMFDLIDRVVDLEARGEGDSDSGQERTEAVPVQQDDQVVPDEGLDREGNSGEDKEESPTSR